MRVAPYAGGRLSESARWWEDHTSQWKVGRSQVVSCGAGEQSVTSLLCSPEARRAIVAA